jgi:AcrR family transcriptional regulator
MKILITPEISLPHSTPKIRWVRPQQPRSQETLERLCEAALRLLNEKSYEQITVEEIAKKAGSSVGGFYGRFADKQALFDYLYDRYESELRATVDDLLEQNRWQGVSLEARFRALAELGMSVFQERKGFFRDLFMRTHSQRTPERLAQTVERGKLIDRVRNLLMECTDEMTHPEPAMAVRIGFFSMMIAIQEKVLFADSAHSSILDVSNEQFLEELTLAFLTYVGAKTKTGDEQSAIPAVLEGPSNAARS